MNLTDDEVLKCQLGYPVLLEDICAVYPATIGEIVSLGYSVFQSYLSVMLMEKPPAEKGADEEYKQLLEKLTDFQYLLLLSQMDLEFQQLLRNAFRFFTHESIMLSLEPAQIVVGPPEEKHLLTEEKFYDLQRLLKRMYFIEQEGEEIIINKDDDLRTRALKEQMRRNRARVRKAKAKEARQKGTDLAFSDLIGSITINNCGLNMVNIKDITYYAFHDQLKRMGWRDQFNINNRAALAGAKIQKSQLKHWMRSIASSDKN